MSLIQEKLDGIIESYNPSLRGDVRRFYSAAIKRQCIRIYKLNDWLQPQNNDFAGVIDEATRKVLADNSIKIPRELKFTDEYINNFARAEVKASIHMAVKLENEFLIRRRMRKHTRQTVAKWLFKENAITQYTSNYSVNLTSAMDFRNNLYLKKRFIEGSNGERVGLDIIADAAKKNMHNENIAISRDMIRLATDRNWKPHFITLTCAGYRRQYTPDLNHEFMQTQWGRMRAYLNKIGIKAGEHFMGMRCEEPHRDGTPHRHTVLFCDDDTWIEIEKAFLAYFLEADMPTEKGARKYRVKIDAPGDDDAEKAAFYCMKYAFKNTNNEKASKFEDSNTTAVRCRAWRQDWGVRAFQFFGCGTKTLFRYCRNRNFDSDDELKIVRAAQKGDWYEFIKQFHIMKHDIKTIRAEIKDVITGRIKQCIGYMMKFSGKIITQRIGKTEVFRTKEEDAVTLILTVPRGEAKAQPLTDFLKKRLNKPPPIPIGALST